MFRTVRGLLRSDAEAEDVTQDAMLTALTSLHRYSPRSDTRFIAWVTTIAINTTRRRFRRRRPELTATGELPDVPSNEADLGDDLDGKRQRAALLQALAELTAPEREIVSLRYGAELNATEIARADRERRRERSQAARTRARSPRRTHRNSAELERSSGMNDTDFTQSWALLEPDSRRRARIETRVFEWIEAQRNVARSANGLAC